MGGMQKFTLWRHRLSSTTKISFSQLELLLGVAAMGSSTGRYDEPIWRSIFILGSKGSSGAI